VSAAAVSRQELESQLAVEEAGNSGYDWGTKDRAKWLAISTSDDQNGQSTLVLDHDKAEEDAAAIKGRIDKWQARATTATEAGIEGGTAPPMHRIAKNEEKRLNENLLPGEKVISQCVGASGQTLVLTGRKVLIIKSGLMAGSTFGAKVSSFDYRSISSVEVKMGPMSGAFQISGGGLQSRDVGYWGTGKQNAHKAPNMVPIFRQHYSDFQKAANVIRSMATSAAHPPPQSAPVAPDPMEQLKKLGELKQAGVITAEEFEAKKAQLLARL
jgi:hypothetical protein